MAAGVQIKVVFNRLPDFIHSMTQGAGPAHVQQTADEIVTDAKRRAPIRTGKLRESIRRAGSGLHATVEVGVPYASYVEYGTSRMGARPYLWPAVEQARRGYIDGWQAILSGTGARSPSLTVTAGRAAVAKLRGG